MALEWYRGLIPTENPLTDCALFDLETNAFKGFFRSEDAKRILAELYVLKEDCEIAEGDVLDLEERLEKVEEENRELLERRAELDDIIDKLIKQIAP